MNRHNFTASGFTLIELMVTVAIISIAIGLGMPSIGTYQRNAELTSTANNLLSAMNTARSEAMKRGMNALVVPNDSTDWAKGWVVFVDVARSGTPTGTGNIQIAAQEALPSYLTLTPSTGTTSIRFDASGFATSNNGTIQIARNDVASSDQAAQTRKVIVSASGRTRACKPASASDLSC